MVPQALLSTVADVERYLFTQQHFHQNVPRKFRLNSSETERSGSLNISSPEMKCTIFQCPKMLYKTVCFTCKTNIGHFPAGDLCNQAFSPKENRI